MNHSSSASTEADLSLVLSHISTNKRAALRRKSQYHSNHVRNFLLMILLIPITIVLAACQQEKEPIYIGVVNFLPAMEMVLTGFQDSMVEKGYEEGVDIIYVYVPATTIEELDSVAENLVNEEVDLILSFSTVATAAAQNATNDTDIPVIFGPVTDPVGSGFVNSLSEPGKNLTGITNGGSDSKRLEWLVDIVPNTEVVLIPYNPNASALSALAEVKETANELGVTLIEQQVNNSEDIQEVVKNIPKEVDAIFLLPDIVTVAEIPVFFEATVERGIPISGATTSAVERGALFAFGTDFYSIGVQAARLADQLIKGISSVSDLPVEPTDFFLDINLATAKIIGLEIPDEILEQAHTIYRE